MGFRHKLDFAYGPAPQYKDKNIISGGYFGASADQTDYLAYNLTISVGYSYGL